MILKPTIIDECFLSSAECNELKEKVLALRDQWQVVIPSNEEKILGCMLPAGMYSKKFDPAKVSANNTYMQENFSSLYEKVTKRLKNYYQREVGYHPTLQLPGFHIFSNTDPDNASVFNRINFHKDAFATLCDYIPVGTIDSIIVPVNLPSLGGSLIYNQFRKVIKDRYTESMEYDHEFNYTQGSMSIWSGNLTHSIGKFTLEPGEYRITLQMHTNVTKEKVTIFW